MARKYQPRGSASAGALPPLMLLGALWGAVGVIALCWASAWLAAEITEGDVGAFGIQWGIALVTADFATTWPGTPTWLVMLLFVGMLVALFLIIRFLIRMFGGTPDGDLVASLNKGNEAIGELARPQAADKAVRLRKRTLGGRKGKSLKSEETGLHLGKVKQSRGANGPSLYASWEDTILAYMAPRAGKTTGLAIPFILSAPGAALATSNKGDVWAATASIREQMTGERVWLFDPQRITHQPQMFWWNPLARVRSVEDANRLAGHFVLTIDDDSKKDMWGPAAKALLSQLILAAALAREPLSQVGTWLYDAKQPRPVEVLFDNGYDSYAEALRETQNIVSETRDGIYTTARTAARCLDDPEMMAWVTPSDNPAIIEIDVDEFVVSKQTLHLLSKSRSAAAPLIAAMTDAVFLAGEQASEGQSGRLDPPLVAVLDEAANICKIADLPDMYSHLGSRGIIPVTILQSYRQGVRVWTENGMEAMWSAATVKLFGAGLDDHKIVDALSKLIGQHDVSTASFSYGDGKGNHSVQLRRQEIMQGSDIRNIDKGDALLFATAAPAVLLKMAPWYEGEHAKLVSSAIASAEKVVTAAAQERYGAPKPVEQQGLGKESTSS